MSPSPPLPDPDPRLAARLRRRLVDWYMASARDLPWRRTRDPTQIGVLERIGRIFPREGVPTRRIGQYGL